MGVVAKQMILERLAIVATEPEALVITPRLRIDQAIDLDSIDLRLGCHFLLPRLSLSKRAHYCPDSSSSDALHMKVHIPLGRYLVLPAHQTVLGSTLEFIKLPFDFSGEILTKSSVARTFTLIETAPWIHPSYRGCLTLEIANVSNTPILLYPGRAIGQLVLMHVQPTPPRPATHDQFAGNYVAPVFPEAPTFRDPQTDLAAIGIRRVWTIPEPDVPTS